MDLEIPPWKRRTIYKPPIFRFHGFRCSFLLAHCRKNLQEITLPEANSLHLKMDGWKMKFLLGNPIFRCELFVSGSVNGVICKPPKKMAENNMGTLLKFNSSPLKINIPNGKGSSSNHHFSEASC